MMDRARAAEMRQARQLTDAPRRGQRQVPVPIAVVGLGCVFPGARDVPTFWENVLAGRSAISAVPADRWDVDAFFDPDPAAPDRTYCRDGGFVRDWHFESRAFRIPPATARVMDRAQQYALVAAREALAGAGLHRRLFNRDRTAVIVGVAAGRLENEEGIVQRVQCPLLERELFGLFDQHGVTPERREALIAAFREEYLRGLLDINEDSFAGAIPNVIAGRIANAFDLHGPSYVVDAACASSLAAVDCAVDSLRSGEVDLALCGGAHAHLGLSLFVGLAKSHGLSRGKMSPFDESADGILLAEGAGLFVLRRLDDAVRDGDRVLGVIRGVGSSSDGREKGVGAPNPRAQALAMRRAMEDAGYSPGTVQFVEAHAAATSVGDPAELDAMHEVFGPHLADGQRIAISAVKSQLGHLMGGAGAAGLMKTVLGLHHGVMPPTINHTRPHPAIPWDTLPFDVVTTPRPWPDNRDGLPRRGNVSAFGFGGNNFHVALEAFDERWHQPRGASEAPPSREPIAIVGVGAHLPNSPDVEAFWRTVVGPDSAIGDVPRSRWDGAPELFVDANPTAPDKCLTRLGAFVATPQLDGRRLRITPATLGQIDPAHKQLLASAVAAIDQTQILASADARQRTAVIVGDSGGCREMFWTLVGRISARRAEVALHRLANSADAPLTAEEADILGAQLVRAVTADRLPVTEDSAYAVSTSLGAARVGKSLDLMGTHMAVDAACASSLAAIAVAVRGLQAGKWDAVITGGVAGGLTPHLAVVASKAGAHSATGSRPFEADADGFVVGEGAVAFALKRLSDAMSDGDRIHGVIRGLGASSDGRGHSMYAPDAGTQALALSRAYAESGLSPKTVQYIECHATATATGDASEVSAVRQVFGDRPPGSLGVGAVKGQIGHTLAAAGAAGLLKAVLGLERKTLPPMPAVARPIAGIDGPLRLITTPEPWPAPASGEPRRAAVNAFGFGGTNWHLVVEEFVPAYHQALVASLAAPASSVATAVLASAAQPSTSARLFVAAGPTAQEMRAAAARFDYGHPQPAGHGPWRLAFVAHSKVDCQAKVDLVVKHYRPGARSPLLEAQGIYATNGQATDADVIAGLFPGQGPQYADMLRDLAEDYEVVRRTIAEADEVLRAVLGKTYAELMFTATRSGEERAAIEQSLTARSDIAQPVLVTAGVALHRLACAHGVRFATVAGHSLGEYTALVAAGALDFQDAVRVAHARGLAFREAAIAGEGGLMAMVGAPSERLADVLEAVPGYVAVANRNCPSQTVLSGEPHSVRDAVTRFEAQGIECRILPIDGASHSRVAEGIRRRMEPILAGINVRLPSVRVLSSVDLAYYEPSVDCTERVRTNLVEQLITPVDFIGLIERLHADGHRVFVELGPKNALTGFVDDILGDTHPHRALFLNHPKFGEVPQFHRFVAQAALLDDRGAAGTHGLTDFTAPGVTTVPARVGTPQAVPSGDRIWITGVSVGLPGRNSRVFSDDGLDRLLGGACFIEPVDEALQDRLVARRMGRLLKDDDGARAAEGKSRADMVTVAARRGGFSLIEDFGLDDESLAGGDIAYQLAVAAGLECLRDARIPLQPAPERTAGGGSPRAAWQLPRALQGETGVVFASAFAGHNALLGEAERYYATTYGAMAAGTIRERYLKRLEAAQTEDERLQADGWFEEQRRAMKLDGHAGAYRFNRNFVADATCMGNARFAHLVQARGPNLAVNAACASTAVALAAAEDMIRCGRARRVVVLAADDVSSNVLFEWVGAGLLASGSVAADAPGADAAIRLDRRRDGMVLGMGAVGFVVEAESAARERGLEPVAELLGVRLANSTPDLTSPDADDIVAELQAFLQDMRTRHAVDARELASNLVYGSHGTCTLANTGTGIGDVDGRLLKQIFGDRWRDVLIVNTKGATGDAQGASLQDGILMKALQAGKVPPVLYAAAVDPGAGGLNVSTGGTTTREYALGVAAGFGSQLGLWLTRVVTRAADRVSSEATYRGWLEHVTGIPNASVTVINRILQVQGEGTTRAGVADGVTAARDSRRRPEPHSAQPARPTAGPEVPAPRAPALVRQPTATAPRSAAERQVSPPGVRDSNERLQGTAEITERVLAIVEEKTGYERQYLELDLDLEADLGIDTIKQAQVMARLRDTFNLPKQQKVGVKDFPTLRHVVQYIQSVVGDGRVEASPPPKTEAPGGPPSTSSAPLPPSVSEPPAEAPPNQGVADVVLGIIEKVTGYEREALEPDLDLEADLGIDTIKQAQVMARLRDQFALPREQGIGVKDFPTIRHILEYVERRHGGVSASPASTDAATGTMSGGAEPDSQAPPAASAASTLRPPKMPPGICRMAVRWATHELDHESANATLGAGWTIVITDDGRGVAEALSRRLSGAGARVEVLRHDQDLGPVRARLGRVRALLLLHPLATDPSVAALDADGWREALERKVIASFQAIRTLRAELEIAVGVTAMSGPYGWRGQLVDPAGAGVAGLLKSLKQEGDELLVKAVDVEPPATAAEADHVAELILGEIERGGSRVEVAYRDGVRQVPRVIHAPLDLSGPELRRLGPEAVIVAIGGSRGVTAAVVKDLATRYHPRLELVASRELPTNIAELAALDHEGLTRLKETIARSWKARLKGIKPIEIEQKYAETLRAIEAFRTVRACEAAGASVRYHVCDVRNGDRLARLIKGLARQHGRIDGVVFGAGVIEDKLIEGKTLESFRRVLGIKAEGMFNLYKALDGVPVSWLVAFSSVAGRFGNTGQTDYSAANEVTARFVCLMQAARPTSRCVAIDWTAWDEVGLAASSGVVELMKERGFEALSPSEGARMLREELSYGATPEEIVIATANLPVDRDGQISAVEDSAGSEASDRPHAGVFIKAVPQYARGAWLSATAILDPRVDTWLRDHTVEGTPLMPAVFAIELMAEAATMLFPSLHVSSIEDLQLHLGVKVLKDRPTTLSVSAAGRTGDSDDERIVQVRVTSDFARPDGRVLVSERLHYSCDVRLRSTAPAAERRDPLVQPGVDPDMVIPPLYGDGGALPHGPAFQVVERVDALDHRGTIASLAAPDARGVLPALNGGRLLTLPFAREGAFQAAGLWAILRHGHFGLPHGCRMVRTYEPPLEGTPLVARVAPRAVDAARMEFDIEVVGPDGRVYDRMEGYYTVNPLEAAAQAARRSESEAAL